MPHMRLGVSDLWILEVISDIALVFDTPSTPAPWRPVLAVCFHDDASASTIPIRFEEEIRVRILAEHILTDYFQYFTSVDKALAK